MSDQISNRGPRKSVLRVLATPVHSFFGAVHEILSGIQEIGFMFARIFIGGRRNQNFENAGRESQKVVRRHVDVSEFRKGERQRTREVMEAERESRKLLNSNSKQAVEYREQLAQRKSEYSRGAAVNHLAMVNARHRKSQSSEAESDSGTPDQNLPR